MARLLFRFACAVFILAFFGARAHAGENMVRNGDFSQGAAANGWPKGWECSGDASVKQTLALDRDPQGGACARLDCAAIGGSGGGASHAMVLQKGTIALKAGQWYRISFRARQQGIPGGAVSVGISDMKTWSESGIRDGVRITAKWKPFEILAQARATVPAANTRLQLWHTTTGTLWIDDVRIEAIDTPPRRYAPVLDVAGQKNLIPNSSFECGTAGWGGITERLGWGNLNELEAGESLASPIDGERCLEIPVGGKDTPVFHFDYFNLARTPVKMPLAANAGWIPVERDADYTLSAYLKADRPGVPATLAVYFGESPATKSITLTEQWQRYVFTIKARGELCFIAIGPDLRKALASESATIQVDAVQFEKGSKSTDYEPACPVEVGIITSTGKEDYSDPRGQFIFPTGKDVYVTALAVNRSSETATVNVTIHLSDFFDRPVGEKNVAIELVGQDLKYVPILTGLTGKGFYRARIRTEAGGRVRETTMRLAIIEPYTAADSPFGMNHAYPWDSMIAAIRQAGVVWMRDWSLKWQEVEPVKGAFTFTETDPQIDRPLAVGEKMCLLLPFSAASWSSSAPDSVKAASKSYPANRLAMAYAPRDVADFGNYVAACVKHYQDRTKIFEILNEPVFTDYSLPQKFGYGVKDYLALLKVSYAAAKKADPQSVVIGGLSSNPSHLALYDEFIKSGGLEHLDILNIHTYPGLAPPETLEPWLEKLNGMMRAAGKVKPMWITEIGYYADDELPRPTDFSIPVLESEKLCAAYIVRMCAIMLANNVEKVFFHSGRGATLNFHDLEGIFFDYGNAPRKMYPAQSALANMLGARAKFVEKLAAPAGLRAYLFQNEAGPLLIAWAEEDRAGRVSLADARLQGFDIQGNPISGRELELSEYPIYVQCPRLSAADAKSAIRIKYLEN